MFNYTVDTLKTVNEAVEALEENLKAEKFGVLWNFDLTAKLQEKGEDFDTPYRILEVCNPKEANRVLSENLMIGYFLPCKIVVYKESDGVKIGMPKPTALIGMVEDPTIKSIAEDIEERLIKCIDQSA
ncbi:DUF302 domain-containing protein [Planococcus kocurii]|uniref:DUF302 domain-containing protein n=1 Tax=Planococcus kocurii TaxID=1374 RepID=A0ABN4JRM4_9BACL|nr:MULTISPECIES: DUF302 domain-containing protein [Planococcus]ALS77558.1 hypothetical protein AUO94_02370 [Planococcus kocurii]KAA0959060.1 DUF302 domain-containing protein [Planococcus sp. ANT_H30]